MQVRSFGDVDGVAIEEVTLRSPSGATASVITWGAVLRDLLVPAATGLQRVVLGLDTLEHYRLYSPYFGATPGRFANRIAGGRFSLDGRDYALATNEKGRTTLHGGPRGFGTLPWRIDQLEESAVRLVLDSPDGDEGFPGAVRARCTYRLRDPGTLSVELDATTDAPTLVNLAHHSYFNLDGSADILDHELLLNCPFVTPTDADNIPTGEIRPVAGTPFDFTALRPIRNPTGATYDHNFVLGPMPDPATGLAHAATVRAPGNGLTLEVHTDQPALQFYDASKLHCPVPGLGGARYGQHGGLALECQLYPDAPHHRHFPSAVLRPGQVYRQHSEYRFA
jgi:aldose 1-epimerase